jgi:prefoldin subunit 5
VGKDGKEDCDDCIAVVKLKKDVEYLQKEFGNMEQSLKEIKTTLAEISQLVAQNKGQNLWVDRVLWLFTTLVISGAVMYIMKAA